MKRRLEYEIVGLIVFNQRYVGTEQGCGGKLVVVVAEGDKERVLELDDTGQGLGDMA